MVGLSAAAAFTSEPHGRNHLRAFFGIRPPGFRGLAHLRPIGGITERRLDLLAYLRISPSRFSGKAVAGYLGQRSLRYRPIQPTQRGIPDYCRKRVFINV